MSRRFYNGIATTLAATAMLDASLAACPICFQVQDGPTASGVRAAVIVLMSVTGVVLGGVGLFLVRFLRRSALLETAPDRPS